MGTLKIFMFLAILFRLRAEDEYHPDFYLNITQTIEKYGYSVESHEVTTEDGYVLKAFRIPHGKQGTNQKPVFLMHGLFGQAENYIVGGSYNASLAYFMADNGFDVWLGNSRGTQHCRKHKSLNPKSKPFWDFSWNEIGMYDLPAYINYILEKTKMKKLYYVGHSQGGTSFYIMTSMRPEYQDKIAMASLLAPAGYFNHFENSLLIPFTKNLKRFQRLSRAMYELPPHALPVQELLKYICAIGIFQDVCYSAYNLLVGYNSGEISKSILPVFIKYVPSVSIRQPLHYGQAIASGHFRPWNYGKTRNVELYGREIPLDYPIKNINVPIAIYYSLGDTLVYPKDVEEICKDLPNCVNKYLVKHPNFTHIDFIGGFDVENLVYGPLLNLMKKYD